MPANKEQIIRYMLRLIAEGDKKPVPKTLETFSGEVSQSTVYNYLSELVEKNVIVKKGSSYELVTESHKFLYSNNGNLGEDRVFSRDIEPLLCGLPKNVLSAWRYAFTEMMNNAIEHSEATQIVVRVIIDEFKTQINILDNGMGIFKNIQRYMLEEKGEELTLKESAAFLFAGKFTTAKSLHSGEGIFFTSHLMDSFMIFSDKVIFSRDNFSDNGAELDHEKSGTLVIMSLDNHSKKTTREVFDRFSNVYDGFVKTQIPISHVFSGAGPVSRSEARRLGELISKFKEVNLDFADVEEVGQAFCHELFIVWQGRNPDVLLNVMNASDDVDFMIRRVNNTKN